jgi:hypothetical protein
VEELHEDGVIFAAGVDWHWDQKNVSETAQKRDQKSDLNRRLNRSLKRVQTYRQREKNSKKRLKQSFWRYVVMLEK